MCSGAERARGRVRREQAGAHSALVGSGTWDVGLLRRIRVSFFGGVLFLLVKRPAAPRHTTTFFERAVCAESVRGELETASGMADEDKKPRHRLGADELLEETQAAIGKIVNLLESNGLAAESLEHLTSLLKAADFMVRDFCIFAVQCSMNFSPGYCLEVGVIHPPVT